MRPAHFQLFECGFCTEAEIGQHGAKYVGFSLFSLSLASAHCKFFSKSHIFTHACKAGQMVQYSTHQPKHQPSTAMSSPVCVGECVPYLIREILLKDTRRDQRRHRFRGRRSWGVGFAKFKPGECQVAERQRLELRRHRDRQMDAWWQPCQVRCNALGSLCCLALPCLALQRLCNRASPSPSPSPLDTFY